MGVYRVFKDGGPFVLHCILHVIFPLIPKSCWGGGRCVCASQVSAIRNTFVLFKISVMIAYGVLFLLTCNSYVPMSTSTHLRLNLP